MPFHSTRTGASIHVSHAFTYANAAARTGAVLVSSDIGKIAKQTDTDEYFVVVNNVGPVWKQVSNPSTTKGDIAVYNPTGAAAVRLPVGIDGYVLTADSSAATGLAYAAPGSTSFGSTIPNSGPASNVLVTTGNSLFWPYLTIPTTRIWTIQTGAELVGVTSIVLVGTAQLILQGTAITRIL